MLIANAQGSIWNDLGDDSLGEGVGGVGGDGWRGEGQILARTHRMHSKSVCIQYFYAQRDK